MSEWLLSVAKDIEVLVVLENETKERRQVESSGDEVRVSISNLSSYINTVSLLSGLNGTHAIIGIPLSLHSHAQLPGKAYQ